jgi:hypothetical protein
MIRESLGLYEELQSQQLFYPEDLPAYITQQRCFTVVVGSPIFNTLRD